jgi:hypothetical protein
MQAERTAEPKWSIRDRLRMNMSQSRYFLFSSSAHLVLLTSEHEEGLNEQAVSSPPFFSSPSFLGIFASSKRGLWCSRTLLCYKSPLWPSASLKCGRCALSSLSSRAQRITTTINVNSALSQRLERLEEAGKVCLQVPEKSNQARQQLYPGRCE